MLSVSPLEAVAVCLVQGVVRVGVGEGFWVGGFCGGGDDGGGGGGGGVVVVVTGVVGGGGVKPFSVGEEFRNIIIWLKNEE